MSEMKWQSLPVEDLRLATYNPRKKLKAGDKEYEKIKNSILEFGYVEPIIVNYDMTVIGGHQRLTVLKDLGYAEVQCVVVEIKDENKVKALNIALNKITGAWNEQLLADLIVDLQTVNFNTDFTGFEAPEIEQLFSKVHNKPLGIHLASFYCVTGFEFPTMKSGKRRQIKLKKQECKAWSVPCLLLLKGADNHG